MGQQKANHYLPRFYLRGFTDPSLLKEGREFVWVYRLDKPPYKSSPDKAGFENHLYALPAGSRKSTEVETELQWLEDKSKPVFDKVKACELNLTRAERKKFAFFLALSVARVPFFHRFAQYQGEQFLQRLQSLCRTKDGLEHWVSDYELESGERLVGTLEELRTSVENGKCFDAETAPRIRMFLMFQSAFMLAPIFTDMHWSLWVTDTRFFVTSDTPVRPWDPYAEPGTKIGFASSDSSEITFPLSRTVCFYGTRHRSKSCIRRLSPSAVGVVNKRTMSGAFREIIAAERSEQIAALAQRYLRPL